MRVVRLITPCMVCLVKDFACLLRACHATKPKRPETHKQLHSVQNEASHIHNAAKNFNHCEDYSGKSANICAWLYWWSASCFLTESLILRWLSTDWWFKLIFVELLIRVYNLHCDAISLQMCVSTVAGLASEMRVPKAMNRLRTITDCPDVSCKPSAASFDSVQFKIVIQNFSRANWHVCFHIMWGFRMKSSIYKAACLTMIFGYFISFAWLTPLFQRTTAFLRILFWMGSKCTNGV